MTHTATTDAMNAPYSPMPILSDLYTRKMETEARQQAEAHNQAAMQRQQQEARHTPAAGRRQTPSQEARPSGRPRHIRQQQPGDSPRQTPATCAPYHTPPSTIEPDLLPNTPGYVRTPAPARPYSADTPPTSAPERRKAKEPPRSVS